MSLHSSVYTLPDIACHAALQNAFVGIDIVEARVVPPEVIEPKDYLEHIARYFLHFTTYDCCFGLSLTSYLLYVFNGTENPDVMVGLVGVMVLVQPSLNTSEFRRKVHLFADRKKRDGVIKTFKLYISDEVTKCIAGCTIGPCRVKRTAPPQFTKNNDIHAMD